MRVFYWIHNIENLYPCFTIVLMNLLVEQRKSYKTRSLRNVYTENITSIKDVDTRHLNQVINHREFTITTCNYT